PLRVELRGGGLMPLGRAHSLWLPDSAIAARISFKTSSLSSSEGLFFFTWSTTPSPPSHCRPHIEHPHLSPRTYILADLYTAGRVRRNSVARQIDPDIILPNEALSCATPRQADAARG